MTMNQIEGLLLECPDLHTALLSGVKAERRSKNAVTFFFRPPIISFETLGGDYLE